MIHILVVIGTRPEAIKMAMLIKAMHKHKQIRCHVCVTAQHRSMLDQVLRFFDITPDIDLDIMTADQQLSVTTGSMLEKLQPVMEQLHPDLVLVHGDTNTTLAAALCAFYNKIPVGHVEAGMRTGNMSLPFPEEANRVLTSRLATWHFAPTQQNVRTLRGESIPARHIIKTGNTVIDALLYAARTVKRLSGHIADPRLKAALSPKTKMILVTGHRRENFGDGFEQICYALRRIAERNPNIYIVYPVHLNPRVKEPVEMHLSNVPNIILLPPLDYPDFVFLMKKSYLLLTDSGGIQEEGPSLGKPVLVMRTVTERPEAVQAGTVQLVGTDARKIIDHVETLLYDAAAYKRMARKKNPYGDGKAVSRIVQWIVKNAEHIKQHTAS